MVKIETEQSACCICGLPIDIQRTPEGVEYWQGGHNAEPVSSGRCCTHCNDTRVVPARRRILALAINEKMSSVRKFQLSVSEAAREAHGPPPPADTFNDEQFPFGVAPGGNKFGLTVCATCGKPATDTPRNDLPRAFLFKNEESAHEYRISGMCQDCQDVVFNSDGENI